MMTVYLLAGIASTGGLTSWVEREVAGQGRLPALADVLGEAETELDLAWPDRIEGWRRAARWRAWIPAIDARLGTDRTLDVRDATTTQSVRTGEGFGVQVRVRWALADAVFNDSVLRVEKMLRDRASDRWRARDRLVKLYFERLELELRFQGDVSPTLLLRIAQIDGLLRAATGGRVKYGRRADNPWPRGDQS